MKTNPNLRHLLLSLDLKGLHAELIRQADDFASEPGRLQITLPRQFSHLLRTSPHTASMISAELMAQHGIATTVTIHVREEATGEIDSQALAADEVEAIATIGHSLTVFASECEQSGALFKVALGTVLRTNTQAFAELLFEQICVAKGDRASVPQLIEKANHGHSL